MPKSDKNVITYFKRIDESDDSYNRKTDISNIIKNIGITSKTADQVKIRTSITPATDKSPRSSVFGVPVPFWYSNSGSAKNNEDNENSDSKISNDASRQFVTIVQTNNRKPPDTPPTPTIKRLNTPNSANNRKMMSSQERIDNHQDSAAVSADPNSSPSKQLSSQLTGERYTISNVLKQMYTLKYMQRQTVSSLNQQASLQQQQQQPVAPNTGANEPSNSSTFQIPTSKQFWMPDDQVKECFECNDKFTMFNRRHHCRVCGQIFCGKCSDYEIPSQLIWPNSSGNIRACTLCHSFVGQMETGDIKHNTQSIKALMQRLSITSSNYSPFSLVSNQLSVDSQAASKDQAANSSEKVISPNALLSTSTPSMVSSSTSSINKLMTQSLSNEIADDTINNPFDITENKEYDRTHDFETSQLNMINSSMELRNLWVQIYHTSDGVTFQTRNINKFKKINNCITGSELVDWLMRTKKMSKDQAIVIGQALIHGKWLECAYRGNPSTNNLAINFNHRVDHNQSIFYDNNAYYKPGSAALSCNNDKSYEKPKTLHDTEEGPEWIKELSNIITPVETTYEDSVEVDGEKTDQEIMNGAQQELEGALKGEIKEVPLIQIQPATKYVDDLTAPAILPLIHFDGQEAQDSLTSNNKEAKILTSTPTVPYPDNTLDLPSDTHAVKLKTYSDVTDSLQKIHRKSQTDLLKQLLKLKNISAEWFDIIMPLVWKCVDLVKPDVKHDNDFMDIRKYIKIKKLPGYDKTKSQIINGLVFTKNVAHKKMNSELKNPTILLLRSSIEYQRSEEKMCSLEPIFTAESQYLKNYCSKLLIRQNPEILIVEKSVARIAQDIFLQSNVSLVLNVKPTLMEKLARFLQADPMYSIDDVLRKPKLGFCSNFRVEKVKLPGNNNKMKPLMFFEGTPTNLGCTILLYGATLSELTLIKSITRFMLYAVYNSKLEQSFIFDKYADFSIKKAIVELKSSFSHFESELIQQPEKLAGSSKVVSSQAKTQSSLSKEITLEQGPLNDTKNSSQMIQPVNSDMLKLEICEENNFQKISRDFNVILDDIILSCSPFIRFKLPPLLQVNRDDMLRGYLPDFYMRYLKSSILSQDSVVRTLAATESKDGVKGGQESELHEFLLMHLTKSFDDEEFVKKYADYKSRGGIASMTTTKRLILRHIEKTNLDTQNNNESTGNNSQQTTAIIANGKKSKLPANFDCLDIFNRQHLAVLFYSQCETSPVFPNICNKPRIIDMKFYCENDMTLGSFLGRNCFRMGYKCNNELCDTLIVYHTRTFAHGDSKITIRMSIVPTASSAASTQLLTTGQTPSQTNMTHSSSLKKSHSSSSFNQKITPAADDKQVFANLNVNALISSAQTPVARQNSSSESLANHQSEQNSKQLQQQLTATTSVVNNNAYPESPNPIERETEGQQEPPHVYDDINIYMWSVCKLCNRSTKKVTMSPDTWSFSMAKYLELTFHGDNYKQFSQTDDPVCCKHSLFQDHYQYFRFRNIVTVFSSSKIDLKYVCLPATVLASTDNLSHSRNEYINEIKNLFEKGLSFQSTLLERISSLKSLHLVDKQMNKLDQFIAQINSDTTLKYKIERINLLLTNQMHHMSPDREPASYSEIEKDNKSPGSDYKVDLDILEGSELASEGNNNNKGPVNYELVEMHLIELRKFIATSTAGWNTKMAEFFKKTKYADTVDDGDASHNNRKSLESMPQSKKDEEVSLVKQLSNTSDVGDLSSGILLSQNEASSRTTGEGSSFTAYSPSTVTPQQTNHNAESDEQRTSVLAIGKRFIANMIPSSAFQPLKIPFPEEEHYLLSTESKYYINDKNLSSIVAFTLSSKDYMEFQSMPNANKSNVSKESNHEMTTNSSSQHGNTKPMEIDECEPVNSSNISNISDNIFHFEHQFYDSTTKFYCKVYYADLFKQLRQLIMPNDEDKYIHSLFRCMNWDAKGGKSNSQFRKTLDNRFVLKEMSKQETQSFVDFAPQYVQYITDSIQNKKATALAKILGAYRICLMKNTSIASKAVKMDVIVMENLFYNKTLTQVFDLKGSERNRMINVTQQPNQAGNKDIVLLDENFLRWSFDNPIYVKPHTKYVLMKAIENDAKFLSSKFVMDYSLLCGFDQQNNVIAVGIIDYLRVFTWDKKVETYLKTISGPIGKMPTIVSPEVYKARFVNAIDRYFLEVPDQWYQKQ